MTINLFKQEDTIVALATPAGRSALAVIRISGKNAVEIISSVFVNKSNKKINIENKKIHYGFIADGDKTIDEVILSYMKSPNSYTGEDIIEISTHGSSVIAESVIELLISKGMRLAEGGEFTYRAFINKKLDLVQAESICEVINSKTKKSAELALASLQGALVYKIGVIKEDLSSLFAYLEVSLDYPEEDIDFLSRKEKEERLKDIILKINKLTDSYRTTKIIFNGVKVAIVGKPNAGKSSVLNNILGFQRAIVTDIAGTTTDTIEETVEYKGIPLTIIDTAGIREHTVNSVEKIGQERTKYAIEQAEVVLWIIDSHNKFDENDGKIYEYLKAKINKTIAVLNKSDLPKNISEDDVAGKYKIDNIINFSAVAGGDINIVLSSILKLLDFNDISDGSQMFLNARQYDLIIKITDILNRTLRLVISGDSDEIVSFEVRQALPLFGEILGQTASDDVLKLIFSKFCVGK